MSVGPEGPQPSVRPPTPPANPTLQQARLAETWRHELLKLAVLALVGAALGRLFDHALVAVCFVLASFLASHLRHLAILRSWLVAPKAVELPDAGGIWGEIYDLLLDLQRKNRKKKRRLTAMLAEFQASTAALPDGAVVLGARGEIAWFNQAAQTLLGLRMPQDVGLRIPNLIRHPSFTEYFGNGDFESEIEAPSPVNRAKTLSLRIIPYGNNQRLLIVRDVSELRRLETARRDFVANASHELRTPLTVLRGYLEMMEPEAQGKGGLADWRGPLLEMRNQAIRMEALVNDMLKLARLEADSSHMKDDHLDVPMLLQRTLDEVRALSRGNHRFEAQIQADLGLVGGETELLSILVNLLSNAVRYTPAGGVIRVRWEAAPEGARFSVADTGIGISEKDLPRLTERFYRVDVGRSRASGGTGLGLSIVKHALERYDARLEIDSEVGVGSTFICHFPTHRVERVQTRVDLGANAA
ncbi:phosphate regulon sensor histidine kinase PhoR [Solimonas sp. K1W22B-7]|uniref:phosphate regulon sensor histidine kinase PhoR n=1 Tax=Solimonas sp. K1W22B-7 TaxID=2303331 RepID=UPI000E32E44F|nr:phosphate regulon sensor histidine kinase PhoR [Solimonas sp. K1W22B-7]AXQ29061.1 phosphate regulon sensor histidine kinase PhoR [Solimonas sp. K1W22B-7]